MHPVLWTALVRLGGIVIAVFAASVVLMLTLVDWKHTGYGDSSLYVDMSGVDLWFVALGNSGAVVGGACVGNMIATLFVTNRYLVGRCLYWIGFLVIAVWATVTALADIMPVPDPSVLGLGLLMWPVTVCCVLVGVIEMLAHRRVDRREAVAEGVRAKSEMW